MPTTIILGTGIIGLSTAYYLSQFTENEDADITPTPENPGLGTSANGDTQSNPWTRQRHEIHLVDSSPELFASASGKAAGFLAKDWFTPAVAPLGEFSFDLHRKLAEEHDGRSRWGYSGSSSYSLDRDDSDDEDEDEGGDLAQQSAAMGSTDTTSMHATTTQTHRGRSRKNDLDWLMSGSSRSTLLDDQKAVLDETDEDNLPRWLRAKPHSLQMISDTTTTGQVDPYRLCQFLLGQCRARGVKLHQPARATQLRHSDPDDPSSKTQIRLEYLGPSSSSPVRETRSSPNSQSPLSEIPIDFDGVTQRSSAEPSNGHGRRGSWASFSTPLDGLSRPSIPSSHSDDYFTPAKDPQNNFLDIQCDSIVIAAGCWTPRVYRTLFPNAGRIPRVTALAGHSVVLKSKHWPPTRPETLCKLSPDVAKPTVIPKITAGSDSATTSPNVSPPVDVGQRVGSPTSSESSGTITAFYPSPNFTPPREPKKLLASSRLPVVPRLFPCHAVFTNDLAGYSPEMFSRLGGDVWVGGYNSSSIPLPAIATWSVPQPDSISILVNTGKALCGDDVEVIREGLCFRPVVPTGRPVIARMHEADLGDGVKVGRGVFVATGHGPWGISLSLGTGYVVSEMVLGRETSVDVKVLGTWEAQAL